MPFDLPVKPLKNALIQEEDRSCKKKEAVINQHIQRRPDPRNIRPGRTEQKQGIGQQGQQDQPLRAPHPIQQGLKSVGPDPQASSDHPDHHEGEGKIHQKMEKPKMPEPVPLRKWPVDEIARIEQTCQIVTPEAVIRESILPYAFAGNPWLQQKNT